MTTYTHNPNNHLNRRASISATAPYTIPNKLKDHSSSLHNSPFSPPSNVHIPQHQQPRSENGHTINSSTPPIQKVLNSQQQQLQIQQQQQQQQQQLSSSVPLLSREFVVRRISEGETGRLKEELKCEACGKGYKHISSLAKHLWEHTPEWNVTKKLLISKHQQVQLLEAASILVSMNEDDIPNDNESQRTNGLVFRNGKADEGSVSFSSLYQDKTSPQPILEEDDENDDEDEDDEDEEEKINIKLRSGSISQYPPSGYNHIHNGIKSRFAKLSSPESISQPNSLTGGSFLDTPVKNNDSIHVNSINTMLSTPEESSKDDEEDISDSVNANTSNNDEDGVFGAMD